MRRGPGDRPRGLWCRRAAGLVAHAALVGQHASRPRRRGGRRCTDRVLHVRHAAGVRGATSNSTRRASAQSGKRREVGVRARALVLRQQLRDAGHREVEGGSHCRRRRSGGSRRRRHGSCGEGWSWRSPECEAELREQPVKLVSRLAREREGGVVLRVKLEFHVQPRTHLHRLRRRHEAHGGEVPQVVRRGVAAADLSGSSGACTRSAHRSRSATRHRAAPAR